MIQAVIFDMDGLIFDTEALALKGWEDTTKRFDCSVTDEELRETIGCANNGIKERLLLRHGKDFDFDAVYAGGEGFMFREIAQKGTPVKKGAPELLSHLQNSGVKTALATSSEENVVKFFFEHANFSHNFDAIACGDMVKNGKPAPDIFLLAASKLGIPPENCLALEDSHNGIRAAHAAGMKVIMVPDLLPPTPEIELLLFKRVDSLLDVIDLMH